MTDKRSTLAIAGAILFTALAVAFLVGSSWRGGSASSAFKMAASTGFLATALAAGALRTGYGRSIFVALIFCWWGDYFLTGNTEHYFLSGLASFLLGHLAFCAAFLIHGVNTRWSVVSGALAVIPAVAVYIGLEAQLGPMKLPVCSYIAIISFMVTLAVGARAQGGSWLILIGALLFYASDLFVARQKFASPSPWNPLLGLPLYYTAQLCLAASVARVASRRP